MDISLTVPLSELVSVVESVFLLEMPAVFPLPGKDTTPLLSRFAQLSNSLYS